MMDGCEDGWLNVCLLGDAKGCPLGIELGCDDGFPLVDTEVSLLSIELG